jgi:hypothetical protein
VSGPIPVARARSDRCASTQSTVHEIEVPSIARDRPELSCEGPSGALRPLAGGAAAARFHRRSKTSTRPLFAAIRGRLPGRVRFVRLLQMYVSTSTTEDRSNIPNRRKAVGTTAFPTESRLIDRGQPPKVRRARGREHRVSTLSTAIARGRDFAPTPIASGTSCRRHRLLPCPERRGKKRMPPPRRTLARRALRKGRATPDFREEIRRSPTRGAFRRRAARGAGGGPASWTASCQRGATAPFSPSRNPHEGRSGRT